MTGAEAAPPMFACDPTAMKNRGARISLATSSIRPPCTAIQIRPSRNRKGLSNRAFKSMCMPMVATSTYSMAEPMVEAPAPSRLRARVKLSSKPKVVASTTIQKKFDVRL